MVDQANLRCVSSAPGVRRARLRALASIAVACLGIGGCGGGSGGGSGGGLGGAAAFTVGGFVSGLAGGRVTISDSGAGSITVAANGSFTLPSRLPNYATYAVTITVQPTNPAELCTVTGGDGTIAGTPVTTVNITCAIEAFQITGSVSGLTGPVPGLGFDIVDNVGDQLTMVADGTFTFATPIASGNAFSVTVTRQPTQPAQFCSVAGGSGTVGDQSPVVTITCSSTTATARLLNFASGQLGAIVPDPVRHRLYFAATARNELIVADADTYLVTDHFFVGSAPSAMALSADGSSLYVGLGQGGALVVVDLTTLTTTRWPIATTMGTSRILSLVEVRPGVVLVGGAGAGTGGGYTSGVGNLVTVDFNHGAAVQVAAPSLTLENVSTLTRSPDGRTVYGLGTTYPIGTGSGQQILFALDATQAGVPVVTLRTVNSVGDLVLSQDSKQLLTDLNSVYDARTLQPLSNGTLPGGVLGETPDGSFILQARPDGSLARRDSTTFAVGTAYQDDCPAQSIAALTPTLLRGEWLIGDSLDSLCVISTSAPSVAPGVPGDRSLPPWVPDPAWVPWFEYMDGATNDVAFDDARGVVYTANGYALSVDTFSIPQQAVLGSIPVQGRPQVVRLSVDGNTLYVGLSDTGELVTIDLNTKAITQRVNLTSQLGTPIIFRIAEISPGHILVGAIPSNGGIGPNTYLVDVTLADPSSAQRVGCAAGYDGAQPVLSPDHHYLYMVSATSCPPEKRDLTQPGDPVVVSGPQGGYTGGNGLPVVTSDGAYVVSGGVLIDTTTMQQTANYSGGIALASANPDRYYLVTSQQVLTMELHDLKVLAIAQNGCLSTLDIVDGAAISGDEKTVIAFGEGAVLGGVSFELCVTRIEP